MIQVVEHRLFYYATISERITQRIHKTIIMLTFTLTEDMMMNDSDLKTFEKQRRTATKRQKIILQGLREVQDSAMSFLTELESDQAKED